MAHRFDAALKQIVADHVTEFVDVLGLPRMLPATELNVDLSTLSAATDAAFGFGEPLQEIVDINFQTGPDAELPARLHVYNAVLHLRHNVPVRSVLILLRPKADGSIITGKLAYVSGGLKVEFEYRVVRMWQQPVEPFLHGGVGLLPLATLCRVTDGERSLTDALEDVVREIDGRLTRELPEAEARRLMSATEILVILRVTNKDDIKRIFRGVRTMNDVSVYDQILDEGVQIGVQQGIEKGLERGLEKGRHEGALQMNRQNIIRLARANFGGPDSTAEAALAEISELDRLSRMFDAALRLKSWQELLATR